MSAKWFNISKSDMQGGVQTLIIRSGDSDIPSNGYQDIVIPIPCKNYEIKTVRVSNDTDASNIVVKLFDSFEYEEVYKSNEQNNIYDIVNVPVEDKNSNECNIGNIYLRISNLSTSPILSTYEIKILNLRAEG